MVTSDFEVVQTVMKVEWKSATIMHGALCVMTCGGLLMLMWSAESWDFYQQVHVQLHARFMQKCELRMTATFHYIRDFNCMFAFLDVS